MNYEKKSVYLKLNDDVEIIVQGDYCPPEEESNFGGQFDLSKIDVIQGSLIDYSNWIEALLYLNKELIITDHIEELALLKLNEII